MRPSNRVLGLDSLGACGLIWGTTWFEFTLQFDEVRPVVSVVYRFGLAAAAVMGISALVAVTISALALFNLIGFRALLGLRSRPAAWTGALLACAGVSSSAP